MDHPSESHTWTDDQEETWTRVKSRSRSRRLHSNTNTNHIHNLKHSNNSINSINSINSNSPSPKPRAEGSLRSVSDITAEYHSVRAQWEDMDCCSTLCSIVAANAPSLPRPISRAICLGIGSFDPPDGGWEAKRKTYVQLISFLRMVNELEKLQGVEISCFFQEPVFTENDKTFLTLLGHRVVDSPMGCDLVDDDAFFYGVHLYRPIYAMALEKTAPAIFVGTGWDVWDHVDLSSQSNTDLANLQLIERTFSKFPFPQDVTTTAFSSTSIYFRPSPLQSSMYSTQGAESPPPVQP